MLFLGWQRSGLRWTFSPTGSPSRRSSVFHVDAPGLKLYSLSFLPGALNRGSFLTGLPDRGVSAQLLRRPRSAQKAMGRSKRRGSCSSAAAAYC